MPEENVSGKVAETMLSKVLLSCDLPASMTSSNERKRHTPMRDAISIMVVDQNPLTVRIVTEAIEEFISVVTACSSLDLVMGEISQNMLIDVMIISLERPFEKAFELLPQIKGSLSSGEVIFVSKFDEESLWIEAIQRGAYDFLPTPLDPTELRRVVRQAVEKHRPVITKEDPRMIQ